MALVDISIRPAVATDIGFVYDSWLKSYRYRKDDDGVSGGEANADVFSADYFPFQRQRIASILAGALVNIAHPVGTPNVIAGWVCRDGEVLHYVYTREAYRRSRIATGLILGCEVCTHLTDSRRADSFAAWKRRRGMRYIPYLLDGA